MIVGLTGLKNVGKDTAAQYLIDNYGFQRFAFGDAIYEEVAAAFGIPLEQLKQRSWKTEVRAELALRNCNDPEFVRMIIASELPNPDGGMFSTCNRLQSPYCTEIQTTPRTSTFIVQRWATEYKRRLLNDDLYWTRKFATFAAGIAPDTLIVVSDLRHMHEYEAMRDYAYARWNNRGGVAHIDMPGAVNTGHNSDNDLSDYYIDFRITNVPGDLPGLFKQVDSFMNRGIRWKP